MKTYTAEEVGVLFDDLVRHQSKQEDKNSRDDKWVALELSTTVRVKGAHPYNDGFYLRKEAIKRLAHVRVRIPVAIGQLAWRMLRWR